MTTTDDKLVRLIWMQRNLQSDFGFNFNTMSLIERIAYLRDQHQAAIVELCEALDEVDWKPWTNDPRRTIRRNELVGELVDVLHFWLNMVLAVSGKMSAVEVADEIFTRYALKNRTNVQRQLDGYDGRTTKCGGCGRALDDVAVQCTREGDQGHCAQTNSDINYVTKWVSPKDPVSVTKPVEPVKCTICLNSIDEFSCVPATIERWGHCGVDERHLPPIKIPTA